MEPNFIAMDFNSLPSLLGNFTNEKRCIKFYEQMRWKGKPQCPHCGAKKPYKLKAGYKCSDSDCYKKFSVKVGTIFEGSKLPFRTWFAAISLCTSHKKGISSVQLAADLGVTQKTAWFMWHRIREMLKNLAPEMLGGEGVIVEADECHIGGIEFNKHVKRRRSKKHPYLTNEGKPYVPKQIVMGIIERGGRVALQYKPDASSAELMGSILSMVPPGTCIFTDENPFYKTLGARGYHHGVITHSAYQYVNGIAHTNTMEGFWSILKRGIFGIYHRVSPKHLHRYLQEFSVRYNERLTVPGDRFRRVLENSQGGLLYKNLVGK